METQKNKNSVFAGIFSSGEPAPQPAHVTQAPIPVVSDEQVAALNKKIEAMERNIVGQLGKKLSEQVPPPPPPPPSVLAPAVLLKMTEMENRLKDFQERFFLGAAQTKNMEESKIGARREIADLLKVVREQQKYSELDRQMHDQLEKAWSRVEEMEKRMMEVYTAAAKKPAEPSAPAASPAEISAAVLKAVGSGLEARLAPLEAALKSAAAKADAAAAAVDVRLAGLSPVIEKLHADSFSGERLEYMTAEIKKGVLSSVRNAFSDSSGDFLRHVDAAVIDGRERLDALGKLFVGHLDELARRGGDNALKIDALESCVRAENEKVLSGVLSAQHGLEEALRAHMNEATARIAAENAWQLERIKEAYGLSASNTAAIAAVAGNISKVESNLGGVLVGLKLFTKSLETINLEALLGVSGALIRSRFKAVGELVAGLERETVLLARAKGEIEANLKSLALKPGREEK